MAIPSFTTLTSTALAAFKIARAATVQAFYDNVIAVAGRGTNAPIVQVPVREYKTSGTSATWTIPAGVTAFEIHVLGGGGGGSGGGGSGGSSTVVYNGVTYTGGGGGGGSGGAGGTATNGDLNDNGQIGVDSGGQAGMYGGSYGTGGYGAGFGGGGGGALCVKRIEVVAGQTTATYTVGAGGGAGSGGGAGKPGIVVFIY